MDDPATKKTTSTDPSDQAVPQATPVMPPTAPSPVSPPLKEAAPIPQFSEKAIGMTDSQIEEADKVAKQENDKYWEAYATEIELEKDIEDLGGMEKVEQGEVKLPEGVAKEMGIKPTVTIQTPIAKATGFSVSGASLTDDQITVGLKKPTSSGFRWLTEWFVYQLLKAHYHLKRIKGKIVRQKDKEML